MPAAVIAAAQARIAAAFPGWTDATGQPHPNPQARLPWFAVTLTLSDAERVGMGAPALMRSADLGVTFALSPPADATAMQAMRAVAESVTAALLAAPADLGGLVWSILPAAEDMATEPAEVRLARAELSFTLQLVG